MRENTIVNQNLVRWNFAYEAKIKEQQLHYPQEENMKLCMYNMKALQNLTEKKKTCEPIHTPTTHDEGLTPTKDEGTCLRRLSMFRKEVHESFIPFICICYFWFPKLT